MPVDVWYSPAKLQLRKQRYRDEIPFVHDGNISLTNAGRAPDQITPRIAPPPHLPEVYGWVEFAVDILF